MQQILWGIGGMVFLLFIAFLLSTDRRAVRPRTVLGALAIQVIFGVVVLYWNAGKRALQAVSGGVQAIINSSREGIQFLFGPVLPDQGLIFAFQVLPVIIFFASLTSVLYHWNILQWVVTIIGGALQKALRTSQAESMNATANIFVGQTEAPLVIRPYIERMTRSEVFAVMVGGLSTVAGSVLVGYSLLGARLEYLIAASFMAAPAGLLMAKMIMPETQQPETIGQKATEVAETATNDSENEEGTWREKQAKIPCAIATSLMPRRPAHPTGCTSPSTSGRCWSPSSRSSRSSTSSWEPWVDSSGFRTSPSS